MRIDRASFRVPALRAPTRNETCSKEKWLDVLAAVDVNLGAVDVGTGLGAQHINDLGDFIRRSQPV